MLRSGAANALVAGVLRPTYRPPPHKTCALFTMTTLREIGHNRECLDMTVAGTSPIQSPPSSVRDQQMAPVLQHTVSKQCGALNVVVATKELYMRAHTHVITCNAMWRWGSDFRSRSRHRHWASVPDAWCETARCSCRTCWQTPCAPHSRTHTGSCCRTCRTCLPRKTCNTPPQSLTTWHLQHVIMKTKIPHCLSVYMCVCLSLCALLLCLSVCHYICQLFCLSVTPSVCLSITLSVCHSVCLSLCLFVTPLVCHSVCLSLHLSVTLS